MGPHRCAARVCLPPPALDVQRDGVDFKHCASGHALAYLRRLFAVAKNKTFTHELRAPLQCYCESFWCAVYGDGSIRGTVAAGAGATCDADVTLVCASKKQMAFYQAQANLMLEAIPAQAYKARTCSVYQVSKVLERLEVRAQPMRSLA